MRTGRLISQIVNRSGRRGADELLRRATHATAGSLPAETAGPTNTAGRRRGLVWRADFGFGSVSDLARLLARGAFCGRFNPE